MARADKFTVKNKQIEYYSDFSTNLDLNPVTGQIVKLSNEEAIVASIKNIVMTNFNERFYSPEKGTNLIGSLFELNTPAYIDSVRDRIQMSIKNYDPRVTIVNLAFREDDAHNSIFCKLSFTLINIPKTFETDIFLKRIR